MRLKRWFALAVLIALAGGCVTSVAPLRADPAKARRACIAVNEATPLAMAREGPSMVREYDARLEQMQLVNTLCALPAWSQA